MKENDISQIDLFPVYKDTDHYITDNHITDNPPESGRTFETDVTRVVHSGLIMRPIYELETRRFRQTDEDDRENAWERIDLMWLAFAVLDTIAEMTEYLVGATRNQILEKVKPLAERQMDAGRIDITDEEFDRILNKIFDHLVNRKNRYLPFEYKYFDAGIGSFSLRRFWLIKTVFTGKGREALYTLTDEGYAAYFGLHETGALDAAAIGNLRIQLLIERGKVDDAMSVAEQNRKQCMRKAHEVRQTRRAILRNIRSVNFATIDALADEGTSQATRVQQESGRLHHMVLDHLMRIDDEKQSYQLHRLAEMLEGLNTRLMELSVELQQLPEDFHAHSHKLFRKHSTGALPGADKVMQRVCTASEQDAACIGREFIARFDPPARRPLFDPALIIEACDRALERQQTPWDRMQQEKEIESKIVERYTPELTEPVMNAAFDLLRTRVRQSGEILLSEVLNQAVEAQNPEGRGTEYSSFLPLALAMAVFQCIADKRIAEKHRLRVELKNPESRFSMNLPDESRYRGHELILSWLDVKTLPRLQGR
ncbi:hypothetical protein QUF76_13380 [Desulfobacterales bacterium HSG16]|nr:hypothetical protein [Desulfobacterales bacterium HSG16]